MPDLTTRDQLRAARADDPMNAELRLVYADCLEELGDEVGAKRHRTIAGLPPALRSLAVSAERFMETTVRPAVLALTVAAALTLLNPSVQGPRLDRGRLQAG